MSELPSEDVLQTALRVVGRDPQLRARMIAECKVIERTLKYLPNHSIRDEVTAPIVDALHADVGILRKVLSTGLEFDFHYRSKIAREFVMAEPENPDHVWEPQTTKLLVHLAEGARNVIIGGGYFGDQALPVARQLRDGTCHVFELNSEQAEMLSHNARLNSINNVVVNRVGLWNDDNTNLSLQGDDSFATAKVTGQGAALGSNTITIDSYVKVHGIKKVDLIMLDIEGAEINALKGADEQLSREPDESPDIVFEVHRHYVDWSNGLRRTPIVSYLLDRGYIIHAVRDFQANVAMGDKPIELIPIDDVHLDGPPHGFNLLAVKRPEVLRAGLFRFCKGVSPKLLFHKSPALHHPIDGLSK